jgi:hypothetical protein
MATSYEARYRAALRAIDAAGLSRTTAEPPHIRLLRGLGLKPRPPHFASFSANFMGHALPFTLIWGVIMWLLVWGGRVPPAAAAVAALLAGIAFGFAVAFLYRGTAERSRLPRWDDLPAA